MDDQHYSVMNDRNAGFHKINVRNFMRSMQFSDCNISIWIPTYSIYIFEVMNILQIISSADTLNTFFFKFSVDKMILSAVM